MRSVEARLRKFRAAQTMKDKLSELKDRIAKVQTIQRSANEMLESENGPNSQIKEGVGSERFSGLDFYVPSRCSWVYYFTHSLCI